MPISTYHYSMASPRIGEVAGLWAWLLPAYWIGGLVLWSLAPLFKAAQGTGVVSGVAFNLSLSKIVLESEDTIASFIFSPTADVRWIWAILFLGLLAAGKQSFRFATGWVLLGSAASAAPFAGMLIRSGDYLNAAAVFAVAFLGLALLGMSLGIHSSVGRCSTVMIGAAIPSLLVQGLNFNAASGTWSWNDLSFVTCALWLLAPLLVLFVPTGPTQPVRRWTALVGFVVSILIFASMPGLSQAAVEARAARNQRQVETLLTQAPTNRSRPNLFSTFHRGVNLTAEFPAGYESADALRAVGLLAANGFNAIALVPYARQRVGEPEIVLNSQRHHHESDQGIVQLARFAHQRGMAVLLKPQISVGRGSRNAIAFDKESDLDRWFQSYGHFIDHYADLAARVDADMLCIGVELAGLTKHDKRWRELIARIRTRFPGPITYAATHGPDLEEISFWDALDFIGLSNYSPLQDNLDHSHVIARLDAVRRRFGRNVILLEMGYGRYPASHRTPWEPDGVTEDAEQQARCYRTWLDTFASRPWLSGVYWWKAGTNFKNASDGHDLWGSPTMSILRDWHQGPPGPRTLPPQWQRTD